MPKFRVELCYLVPHYVEFDVEATDAEGAQALAFASQAEHENDFTPCHEATGETFVSECVEGDHASVADAMQDDHRPIHPDYRSDEQNTAAARDKLYAFVERVAAVGALQDGPATATLLRGLVAEARDLIGWLPEQVG